MRLYLPRFHVRSQQENLAAMHRDARDAASGKCAIILFPEMFLTGYQGENDSAAFRREFSRISADCPVATYIFGSITEDRRNRLYVYSNGQPIAHYDKIHLFYPNAEQNLWETGNEYAAVDLGDVRIGLATCNDVRFPEQLRELKLKYDINLAVYPALWPWRRDNIWSALLRARAIENGIFVAGCCISGIDNGIELFDGAGNHVFDPNGDEVTETDRIYEIDLELTENLLVDTREQYKSVKDVRMFSANSPGEYAGPVV